MSYEPTCTVCIHADATGHVPPRHDCPDAHVATGADEIVRGGGAGPASPDPAPTAKTLATAKPSAGAEEQEGRGESDAVAAEATAAAPAPLQALARLIDDVWCESCEIQDDRSPGELTRDVILDPANQLTVAEALIEAGRLVFAGSWIDARGDISVPLYRIGGAS